MSGENENQQQTKYEDITRIVGEMYIEHVQQIRKLHEQMGAVVRQLQEKIAGLIEENTALKTGKMNEKRAGNSTSSGNVG